MPLAKGKAEKIKAMAAKCAREAIERNYADHGYAFVEGADWATVALLDCYPDEIEASILFRMEAMKEKKRIGDVSAKFREEWGG